MNISKEQAINIAKMQAQNTSWTVNMGNGSVVEVANVTILDDHTGASLLSAPREPLVLYPHWTVSLTFDQVYPGYVYGVTYNIWADTGEVFYGFLTTLGGSVSSETDSSAITTSPTLPSQPPQQSPPQLDDPPDSPPEMTAPPSDAPPAQEPQDSGSTLPLEYGYAAAVVSIIAVAATALLLKRKKGK